MQAFTFIITDEEKKDCYPMCQPQLAQIDCRKTECKYHKGTACTNPAPAITLNPSGKCVCWSELSVGGKT